MTAPALADDGETLVPTKKLGALGVLMPGVAQIAPAFNLFFTTAVMASLAGPSVPLVFLISMVGMLATALSLAQFSSVYPSAGSFVTYISRSLGVRVATAVGVITILGYMITFAGIYIFAGQYIVANVFGVTSSGPGVNLLTVVVTIVYGAIVTVPVIIGLQFGVRVTVVLYVIEVVVLLTISFAVLAQGGAEGLSTAPFSWPTGTEASNIFITFGLAVVAFGGFEASAPLAEETANPRRNVPIGLVGAVLISGFLYVIGSYAVVSAFGVSRVADFAKDPNPFATATVRFLHVSSAFAVPFLVAIFLISLTSSYISANTQTARVLFAGARGRLWPRALDHTHPRFGTPWVAAIWFVAPSIVLGCIMQFADPADAGSVLPTLGIFGVVIMYLVTNVALVVQFFRLRRRGVRKNPVLWVAVPILGVLVLLIPVWGNLRLGQAGAFAIMPELSVLLILVGVAYTIVLAVTRPAVLAAAPALLEGAEAIEGDPAPPVGRA
ncbi:MAG TPA: APC family permease [Amnibacterium sp.]|jgi:amino acid transporter|uniref:APC family permease n=1 Tax=Amnibacterium sp. TaxID=1872496 RepID=UPI002F952129